MRNVLDTDQATQSDHEFGYPPRRRRDRLSLALKVLPVLVAAVLVAAVIRWWPSTPDGEGGALAAIESEPTPVATAEPTTTQPLEPIEPEPLLIEGSIGSAGVSGEDPGADDGSGPTTSSGPGSAANEDSTRSDPSSTAKTATTDAQPGGRTATTKRTATTERSATTPAPDAPATTDAPTTTEAPTTTAAATTTARSGDGSCGSGARFERVFRDDFNGSSLGGHWSQFNSPGNSNHGLRRPRANTVAGGKLVITASMRDGNLESGGMSHGYAQTYGKYRVRVRTDNDPNQALSGVVLTWPQSGVHPRDGENNIYETLVKTPNRNPFYTFIHKPFGSKSDQEVIIHRADASQWIVMEMEWTPNGITIIRDGARHEIPETSADLIPDVPHRFHIQLDAWKDSMSGSVRMEVDWAEVYKYCG